MMTTIRAMGLMLLGALLAAPVAAQGARADDDRGPQTLEVRMVDKGPTRFVFEPAEVTVRLGDRVVWVQTGVMPHNVEFAEAPEAGNLEAIPSSPYLTTRGQTFELVIDGRFAPGVYTYICTPHVGMGMKGTIEVLPAEIEPVNGN
jgi:plastocyanin